MKPNNATTHKKPNLFSLFPPYRVEIGFLLLLTVTASGLGLALPKIIATTIDAYMKRDFSSSTLLWQFGSVSLMIFVATYLQNILQTYTSEKIAKDLRNKLSVKISMSSNQLVEEITAAKILTNLTSDVDSIKFFISMGIATLISSFIIIIGTSVLLLTIDWQLALAVLTIIPILGAVFYVLFSRVRLLFKKRQEVIDWLNRVINESILGAFLVRVLDSGKSEFVKFSGANDEAKNIGIKILSIFASLIPLVTFIASLGSLIIFSLGGYFVINNTLTLGELTAFNSYIGLLIFPILILGFMSNVIAQASASFERITDILESRDEKKVGNYKNTLNGEIEFDNVSFINDQRSILKNVSFLLPAGSRTAIIGPTAAGKTQLLNLLIGLTKPTDGNIKFDNHPLESFDQINLHEQIGLVFQDSIIFNLSLRENIAFNEKTSENNLSLAIKTAELEDLISTLPQGLETIISERGTSLSGGQKQRIMLARALALNPKILLLDDFTARVDNQTERKILTNVEKNYPNLSLVSVTQKISSIEKYDQIILLMEGEVIATGKHAQLMDACPEYVQIFNSQQSTNEYE